MNDDATARCSDVRDTQRHAALTCVTAWRTWPCRMTRRCTNRLAYCWFKRNVSRLQTGASFGARSFGVAAPKICNSLPLSARSHSISPYLYQSWYLPSSHQENTHYSRPSIQLNPSLLAPHIRLLLTIVRVYKLYLLTYLLFSERTLKQLQVGRQVVRRMRPPGYAPTHGPTDRSNHNASGGLYKQWLNYSARGGGSL